MTGTVAMGVILAHLLGDYVVQSDWMANEKTKNTTQGILAAMAHSITYGLCYLIVTQDLVVLFVITATHYYIDRYRLARYVCWAKNQLAPRRYRYPLREPFRVTMLNGVRQEEYAGWTGYESHRPDWLAGWLMFICDNTLHLCINVAAILWLT